MGVMVEVAAFMVAMADDDPRRLLWLTPRLRLLGREREDERDVTRERDE